MAKYAHILLEKSLFFKRTNTFVGSVFDYLAMLYNYESKRLPLFLYSLKRHYFMPIFYLISCL